MQVAVWEGIATGAIKWGAKELTVFDVDQRTVEVAKKKLGFIPQCDC